MSVIIRLQNLPLTATSVDIRAFFRGLNIPGGAVHIVGGPEGDAFIAFSTDEDARQAMQLTGQRIKDAPIKLLLSSRNEMYKVIEQARFQSVGWPNNANANSNSAPTSTPVSTSSETLNIQGANTHLLQRQNLEQQNAGSIAQAGTGAGAASISAIQGLAALMGQSTGLNNAGTNLQHLQNAQAAQALFGAGTTGLPNQSQHSSQVPPMNSQAVASTTASGQTLGSIPNAFSLGNVNNSLTGGSTFNTPNQNLFPGLNNKSNNQGSVLSHSSNIMNQNSNVPQGLGTGNQANFQPGLLGPAPSSIPPAFQVANQPRGMNIRGRGRGAANFDPRPSPFRMQGSMGLGPAFDSNRVGGARDPPPSLLAGTDFGRSRSRSKERRDRDPRRYRSRSNDRDSRRRRRSRSRSRSRSRDRDRGSRRSRTDRRRSDSSSEKDRAESETDGDTFPCLMLTGVPHEASFRDLREFIRVDIMGGGEGTVRLYEEGLAYLRLDKISDFFKAMRAHGKKLVNSIVKVEGISLERWVEEYKKNRGREPRDIKELDLEDKSRDSKVSSRSSRFSSDSSASFNCIAVRGLPSVITKRDVEGRFLKNIQFSHLFVVPGNTLNGRPTSTAYVELTSSHIAEKLVDSIVRAQDGSLIVELCNNDEMNAVKKQGRGHQEPKSLFDDENTTDPEYCSVLIRGAPTSVTENDIYDFFSDLGLAPVHMRISRDSQGNGTGQIICEFGDYLSAKRAATKDGMIMGRNNVTVFHLPPRKKNTENYNGNRERPSLLGPRPPRFQPRGPNPFVEALQGPRSGSVRGGRHPNPRMRGPNPRFHSNSNGYEGREGPRNNLNNSSVPAQEQGLFSKPDCVIALENVPFRASMDDILQFLEGCLKIRVPPERLIRRYDVDGKPTGDARCAFETPMEAKLASERLNGCTLWKRSITASVVQPLM